LPIDLDEAAAMLNTCAPPSRILYKREGKYFNIKERLFS